MLFGVGAPNVLLRLTCLVGYILYRQIAVEGWSIVLALFTFVLICISTNSTNLTCIVALELRNAVLITKIKKYIRYCIQKT